MIEKALTVIAVSAFGVYLAVLLQDKYDLQSYFFLFLNPFKKFYKKGKGGTTVSSLTRTISFMDRFDCRSRSRAGAQFAGSSSVPAHVEMMGLIGAGNNPMVGMTVAVAVAIEEASK